MTKRVRLFAWFIIGLSALWGTSTVYYDYWSPSRDLQMLGIDWIRPWTARTIDRYYWFDGSQVVYTFEISAEQEQSLRTRCISVNHTDPRSRWRGCYLAHKRRPGEPTIELEVQAGVIRLYYTG